jgi:hypothetical protein
LFLLEVVARIITDELCIAAQRKKLKYFLISGAHYLTIDTHKSSGRRRSVVQNLILPVRKVNCHLDFSNDPNMCGSRTIAIVWIAVPQSGRQPSGEFRADATRNNVTKREVDT